MTQHLFSRDGFRLAYEVHGSGPALLLLHGFSTNRSIWSSYGWIDQFQSDFTVITCDLRGCGESDAPDTPEAYSVDTHLDDLYRIADACGAERFCLWGWSFGGTLGLQLAANSLRIDRAVIAGTYFGRVFTDQYVQTQLRQFEPLAHAKQEGRLDQLNLSVVQRAFIERTDLTVYMARLRGLLSWPAVTPSLIRCPMLVYSGTADSSVVRQLEQQRASIEAARIRLHIFESLSHLQLVSETAVVAPVVSAMLRPH